MRKTIQFLESYDVPVAKFAIYSLIYQYAMNNIINLKEECEKCGGKCCKSGLPVPVYDFDYEEMTKHIRLKLEKKNSIYLIPRPCKYQKGWTCSINSFKPYACLSYPFATEDEQIEVIKNYNGKGVPDFNVPDFCTAGKKVKALMDSLIKNLRKEKGREPKPEEVLIALLNDKRR
ncbi:YkgJ family cysteine cluster protein [Stygiolobus caldivivus]|uniref:YkgJ family cysteine cluster protein n=1 Tax=Stygiolobus caldivivus TaxID=2824673 RepID=UPI001CECCE56|nr:YkgJ family cysteine cluster protein [Stygiolobus caldivivus]